MEVSEVKMVVKSPLWNHFDSVKYEGQKFARCKLSEECQVPDHFVPIRADCSTSGLWRHLSAHHPEISEIEEVGLTAIELF